jgi:hypothetical protein
MQYWNIQAQNTRTGQTVKQQDLAGYREINESRAWEQAHSFAEKLSVRSRDTWMAKLVWTTTTDR